MNNSENNNVMPNGVVPNNTNVNPVPNPTPSVPTVDTNPVTPVAPPVVTPPVAAPTAPVEPSSNDTEELLEVAPPTVAPPTVTPNANVGAEEESRILKPIVETLEEEMVEEKKEEVVVPQVSASESMASNVIAAKEKTAMENRNLKEVKVEYKEPGFFRKFLMFFIIGALLVTVFFLPEITAFLDEYTQNKEEDEPVVEQKIMNGTLTCEKSNNDKTYDYIYAYDFDFENNQLDSMNYSVTTKGSVATDVDDLTAMYNSCKNLSGEFVNTQIGTSVSCDLIGATYVTSYHIDYSLFDDTVASPIITKYKVNLPEYEYNQNIDDIERNLTNDGFTCDRNSNE